MTRLYDNNLKTLAFEGLEPGLENLKTGRYPLSKDIYLLYKEHPSQGLEAFLAWLGSERVADMLQGLGNMAMRR